MAQAARAKKERKKSQNLCSLTSIKDMPDSNEKYHLEIIRQLIKRRQKLKISQRQLGERIGVTDYLLSKWEGNHRRPTGFLLWCWAESLGLKLVVKKIG